MIDEVLQAAQLRMAQCIAHYQQALTRIRGGRAHPSLLEPVRVPCYGSDMPLNQVASIATEDPRTLLLTPWDKSLIPAIEKAILQSSLGLNPATSGGQIRVPLPPLNEERRKDMIRLARHEAEEARVALRAVRREANQRLKQAVKDHQISDDEERRGTERVQKMTDTHVAEVEQWLQHKEEDLMTI